MGGGSKETLSEEVKGVSETPIYFVTADWHLPFLSDSMFRALYSDPLTKKKKGRERYLIIGGDFLNFDMISRYENVNALSVAEEVRVAREYLSILSKMFNKIYWLPGNHEERLASALKATPGEALKLLFPSHVDKVTFLERPHFYISTSVLTNPIFVVHPANYSKVPLAVARSIFLREKCNVFVTHQHHCALGVAPDGVSILADVGVMCDISRIEYASRKRTTHPNWGMGYIVVDGKRIFQRVYAGGDQVVDTEAVLC
jgi:hypothetical protein